MNELISGGIYRHYKGNLYRILYIATHTETEESLVIYQAMYGEEKVWARPLAMFLDDVTLPDGRAVPRFALVEE